MLTALSIRDVVLIEALDLTFGPGLTALTGETGAGKSILLDALGLATGARADAGLVRAGARQAMASAAFEPGPGHPVWLQLEDRGLAPDADDVLVLRRTLGADGRSRAFVNDQAVSVGALREIAGALVEVHGQHETVGLLDPRTHRGVLDAYAGARGPLAACADAWRDWRAAEEEARALREAAERGRAERDLREARLAELDALDPQADEEASLVEARAVLGASEKTLAELSAARSALSDERAAGLAHAFRALSRARDRAVQAGIGEAAPSVLKLQAALEAVDRALIESAEASASVEAAADAFEFDPTRLEATEERLFALRGAARKLGLTVAELPGARAAFRTALDADESAFADADAALAAAQAAQARYADAADAVSKIRLDAARALEAAVAGELEPLKLGRARFRVTVEPLAADRGGPDGRDRVVFQVETNPGLGFGDLGQIASGGELARFALAMKAALAARTQAQPPLLIFDEVDQGVGGAVADAVGLRLRSLGEAGQVLVVTHSPQVAARAVAHLRVRKADAPLGGVRTEVDLLDPGAREEEIARMLSGSQVTEAARAAARALIA